jgi:dTDP-4-amino-4,6-dideoxygalactose transaminase
MIPLFKPFISESITGPLKKVLLSGYVGLGPKVNQFENLLKERLSCDSVIALNSATSGLRLALQLCNIGPGDEVISPPLTFFGTSSSIINTGAFINWADIDPDTCNSDIDSIVYNVNDNTKAIMLVHLGGYPNDIDLIKERVNNKAGKDIPIIEDCAHAFGSKYKGRAVGSSGNYCVFSFQAIKHLTTIDGGCICVPSEQYERAKLLHWYGVDRKERGRVDFRAELDIQEAGCKYHMNDVNAVIGIEQLKYVDENIKAYRNNAQYYDNNLINIPGLTLTKREPGFESTFWMYPIKVENKDDFERKMKEKGIITSKVHERNDIHTCTIPFKKHLPQLDFLMEQMTNIPVGWWVTKEDREYVVDCIKEGW